MVADCDHGDLSHDHKRGSAASQSLCDLSLLLNVGKVLRLGWFDKLTKLVLPASLPYIFTGMRLSLGVGWMVLIAAEMLAQNPGLGKFVWDEFQNGSSQSLARIMFAVVIIGLIGFMLDRGMMALQTLVSKNRTV